MATMAADDRRGKDGLMTREACVARWQDLTAPASGLYLAGKAAMDFTLALVLSVVTAPIMVLAMAAIKLTSRGPVLYTQTRLGMHGKPFVIFKLRTMAHDCESLTGARWCLPNDPRVTPLGRILRFTHIDELPQLWNVFKGEMSLVGPRPERPEFLPQLEQTIPLYRARLLVKPGVTGLAQVQLPPDTNLASVRLKLTYDLFYVNNPNLLLDLRILLGTASKLAAFPFRLIRVMLGLPNQKMVELQYAQMLKEPIVTAKRVQTA